LFLVSSRADRASLQYTRRLLSGLLSFVPGGRYLSERNTGGTDSARYCYWVWLHHLILARQHGLAENPRVVAELGPGDSLGAGLAAVLSGADRYYAFDIVSYADVETNLRVLEELVDLYAQRSPVTGEGFRWSPMFELDRFPEDSVSEVQVERALAAERLDAVRGAVQRLGKEHGGVVVAYEPSWLRADVGPSEQPHIIFSQAVLEHVDDLRTTYEAMFRWLAPGGFISHEIDFRSHDYARAWNGHWTYPEAAWALIRGRRRFAINREPLSTHLRLIEGVGFRIVNVKRLVSESTIPQRRLAARFRSLSEEDLTTRTALIQAVKDPSEATGQADFRS
jgi:SAM-dependent methyltransferase